MSDRATLHISIDDAATADEADAFFLALSDWVGQWMDAHPKRGYWDPFVYMHTEACEDSDHCYGPGSVAEREIMARRESLANG